jgi:hypothetical protein
MKKWMLMLAVLLASFVGGESKAQAQYYVYPAYYPYPYGAPALAIGPYYPVYPGYVATARVRITYRPARAVYYYCP